MVVVPIIVILFSLGQDSYRSYNEVKNLEQIQEMVSYARKSSVLVHNLQKERGASAGFISSKGENFASQLTTIRTGSDTALKELQAFYADMHIKEYVPNLQAKLAKAMQNMQKLQEVRNGVSSLSMSVGASVAYYTATNNDFIASIEEIAEGYKVVIEGSYFNVSLLRAPFSATLEDITIKRGARLSSLSPLSQDLNEQVELLFSDKKSLNKIKIVHMLKQSFAPIAINVAENQSMMQGSRYGLMVNGTTTLYLPTNFRLNVSVGSELVASETLVGYFTL